ncbi:MULTISPECIES: hypothetical protein [Achromobacter]|uniref:hypothetical protein n=1 Tax=Achromobacter TaxID=222 RepID=UPI002073B89A|nr:MULTISPECIES: hypothetical protein [Achromobacter]WLW63727.1 hypothetical protein RA224_09970 [Achromobacter aegrifaciens]
MMRTYARIENGAVVEIIKPLLYDDGTEIPIELRFPPFFLEALVDVTNEEPMPGEWWAYNEGMFTPPQVARSE